MPPLISLFLQRTSQRPDGRSNSLRKTVNVERFCCACVLLAVLPSCYETKTGTALKRTMPWLITVLRCLFVVGFCELFRSVLFGSDLAVGMVCLACDPEKLGVDKTCIMHLQCRGRIANVQYTVHCHVCSLRSEMTSVGSRVFVPYVTWQSSNHCRSKNSLWGQTQWVFNTQLDFSV